MTTNDNVWEFFMTKVLKFKLVNTLEILKACKICGKKRYFFIRMAKWGIEKNFQRFVTKM